MAIIVGDVTAQILSGGSSVSALDLGGVNIDRVRGLLGPDNVSRPTFTQQVARGLVANWSVVHCFGRNPSVGLVAEELWEPGGVMILPTSAGTVSVASDSASDTLLGTGVQTIGLVGLDANWNYQAEIIDTDGVTPAVSVGSYLRVLSLFCDTAGTNEVNVGKLTATLDGNTISCIAAGEGISHSTNYSVPADHRAFLVEVSTWQGRDNTADVGLHRRAFGKSWRRINHLVTYRNTTHMELHFVEQLDEKSDFKVTAIQVEAGQELDQTCYYVMLQEKYK